MIVPEYSKSLPKTSQPSHPLFYRPDLQGFRAIAVMVVILAHAGFPWLTGGFIGVDMFFVLSGYLISGLLMREFELNARIAFLQFYARRLKRLLPALLFIVGTISGLAFWLLSEIEARAQLSSAGYAVTWTSNLHFALHTLDYFDELTTRNLFLHTWSLGVEEQFYIFWPLLLVVLFRLTNWSRNGRHTLALLFGLIFSISLGFSLFLSFRAPQFAFYLMPSRIWQFALGGIVFLSFHTPLNAPAKKSHLSLKPSTCWMALAIGLTLVLGSATMLHPNMTYPGGWALFPSFGAALLIAAGHGSDHGKNCPLAHPALVWIGDRSYSWYLWHWPILLLGYSLGLQGQTWPTVVLVLLSLLLASLSYQYVELPFWKGKFSLMSPARIIFVSIFCMFFAFASFFHLLRSPYSDNMLAQLSIRWRTDVPVIYKMSCDSWYHNAKVEPCVSGPPSAKKTVVLLGDSVGAQWFSAVPGVFPEPDWQTVVFTKSSCPMVDEDIFYARIGKIYDVCRQWRDSVLTEIEHLRPEVIILGSAATYEFNDTQWIEGGARIIERLAKVAQSVFIIPGTPQLGFDGPECLARNLSSPTNTSLNDACTARDRLKQAQTVTHYLYQAASRFQNVRVLELNDLVCPKEICHACDTYGTVVFRDSQHLTDSFVRLVTPEIRQRIEKIRDGGNQQ